MNYLGRTTVGLCALVISAGALAQFTPERIVQYGTYAGTNSGFNYLPDSDVTIIGPHAFDSTATHTGSGGESATTRIQGSITTSQVWLKSTTSTTVRSSTSAQTWYDFTVANRHIKLDYVTEIAPLVWWDNVIVRVYDQTSPAILFNKEGVTETGSVNLDVVPGHRIRLYMGINQNNLNGFSYPAGATAFRAEGTITPLLVPAMLNVHSTNPASGVAMNVLTPDYFGIGSGVTAFDRTYDAGGTASVIAPLTTGTQWFDHWEKDGIGVGNTHRRIDVEMESDHTINAIFLTTFKLNVFSQNPTVGIPITVLRTDKYGLRDGTTRFTRTYVQGVTVPLTAPATLSTRFFIRWNLNGSPWMTTRGVTVPMSGNQTVTAVYGTGYVLTVGSSKAAVPITATKDRAGLAAGTTTFTRLYAPATTVTLTAPATADGKAFVQWKKDGVALPGHARTTSLSMDAAHNMYAVYAQ